MTHVIRNQRPHTALFAVAMIALILHASSALANSICPKPDCLASHDINGIRLGMSVSDVAAQFPNGIDSLGQGYFEGRRDDTSYSFEFTSLGHLFLIETKQNLGFFTPDLAFGAALTRRLASKYGPPEYSQLPGGIADWSYVERYDAGGGLMLNRFTEQLSARLEGGFGQPMALDLHLVDFRILRHDDAAQNAGPEKSAADAIRF